MVNTPLIRPYFLGVCLCCFLAFWLCPEGSNLRAVQRRWVSALFGHHQVRAETTGCYDITAPIKSWRYQVLGPRLPEIEDEDMKRTDGLRPFPRPISGIARVPSLNHKMVQHARHQSWTLLWSKWWRAVPTKNNQKRRDKWWPVTSHHVPHGRRPSSVHCRDWWGFFVYVVICLYQILEKAITAWCVSFKDLMRQETRQELMFY